MGNCGKIPYKEIGNWTQRTGPLAQPRGVGVSSVDNRDRDLEKGLGMCVCVCGGGRLGGSHPSHTPILTSASYIGTVEVCSVLYKGLCKLSFKPSSNHITPTDSSF